MNYPIYQVLKDYECEKCKQFINKELYSMIWEGKTYCPRCALEMKKSGEVVDKELVQTDFVKRVCKTCNKLINDRPDNATQCLECIKQGRGL